MRVSVLTSIVIALASTANALPISHQDSEIVNYEVEVTEQGEGFLTTVKNSVTTLLGLEDSGDVVEDPDYWKHF
ncbi:hypothetical protein CANARDRAFT_5477, partial [[Candida] arabinofermentans NRRL YB-2248]